MLADQLGTALDGRHAFRRLNPAVGLTSNPTSALTLYATYNEGLRAPTPVELTCADPAAPCALPNAFSSDPALKPVISRNAEFGARGKAGDALEWSLALFRTDLHDDIQFVSSGRGATGAGYFRNVGVTRRQGVELGLQSRVGALALTARYSLVDATFRTPLVLNSPNNSTARPISCDACTDIAVRPGNRLPGIARNTLKVNAAWATTRSWRRWAPCPRSRRAGPGRADASCREAFCATKTGWARDRRTVPRAPFVASVREILRDGVISSLQDAY